MSDDFGANYIESMRVRFSSTANPVWAWQAILACGGGVTGSKYPLPEWCIEYLHKSAANINGLWSDLLPAEALSKLPGALDFSSPGANAFKDAEADLQAIRLAIRHDVELRKLSTGKATAEILKTVGIEHENLKKKLARGRRVARLPKRERPRG